MDSNGIMQNIKNDYRYRGQIIEKTYPELKSKYKSVEGCSGDLKEIDNLRFSEFCQQNGFTTVYAHHVELFKKYFGKEDIIINLPTGSGVDYALDVASLFAAFNYGQNILYLCNKGLNYEYERLERKLRKLKEYPLLTIAKGNASRFNRAKITFLTPSELFDKIISEEDEKIFNNYILTLDKLLIQKLQTYSAPEFTHLKEIIKILNLKRYEKLGFGSELQLIISCSPIANVEDLGAYFFPNKTKREFSKLFIHSDSSKRNGFTMYYWHPPLETEKLPTANKLSIKRLSLFEDLKHLLDILNEHLEKEQKVLLWFNNYPIFWHQKQEFEKRQNSLKISLTICNDLTELNEEEYYKFQFVILVSVPQEISTLTKIFGKLICERDGIVLIMLPENFKKNQMVLSKEYCIENETNALYKLPKFAIIYYENIEKYYFKRYFSEICSLQSIPVNVLRKFYPMLFDLIVKNNVDNSTTFVDKTHLLNSLKIATKNSKQFGYGLSSNYGNNSIIIRSSGIAQRELVIDLNVSKLYFQKGMVVYLDDKYYVVEDKIPGKTILEPYSRVNNMYCFPDIKIKEIKKIKADDTELMKGTISKIKINIKRIYGDVSAEILGYHYFSDPSLFDNAVIVKHADENIINFEKEYFIVMEISTIENTEDISALLNILKQFISNQYIGLNWEYLLASYQKSIVLIPLNSGHEESVNYFVNLLKEFLAYLEKYVVDQFFNCICENGCPLCVKEICSQTSLKDKVTRNSLFIVAGEMANKAEEVKAVIENRSEKVPNTREESLLVFWRNEILRLFANRFNMKIEDAAKILSKRLPAGILGLFDDKSVQIQKGLGVEKEYVEVVAHEYAHNWQAIYMNEILKDPQLPLDGKIFVEGFAQWVAFRVMDFYGLYENMSGIELRGLDEGSKSDEYGVGFMVCKYIEEKISGFHGLINFMKTAELKNPHKEEQITLDTLFKDSGVYTILGS